MEGLDLLQKDTEETGNHGRALKAFRNINDFSREGLGLLVGLSEKQIINLEKKKAIPRNKLELLAPVLNVKIEWFDRFDWRNPTKIFYQDTKSENKIDARDSSCVTENVTPVQNGEANYYEQQSIVAWQKMLSEKDSQLEEMNRQITDLKVQLAVEKAKKQSN